MRPVSKRAKTINDVAIRGFLCEKEMGCAKSEIVDHCKDEFPKEEVSEFLDKDVRSGVLNICLHRRTRCPTEEEDETDKPVAEAVKTFLGSKWKAATTRRDV